MAKVCILPTHSFLLIMNIKCYILTENMKIISHGISWVESDPEGSSKLSSWKVSSSVAYSYVETFFFWLYFCSEWAFILDLNYNFITGRSSLFWHLCWRKKLQRSKCESTFHMSMPKAPAERLYQDHSLDPVNHCLWKLLKLYIDKNMSSLITHGILGL